MTLRATRYLLASLIFGALAVPACAEITAEQAIANREMVETKLYLAGIGAGFTWANANITSRKLQPTFCAPAKLGITAEQYGEILADYVKENPASASRPVGAILLASLQRVFPC